MLVQCRAWQFSFRHIPCLSYYHLPIYHCSYYFLTVCQFVLHFNCRCLTSLTMSPWV